MARVTVEDCLAIVPDRYKLVVLASQRTRELFAGIARQISRGNKNAVIALREIAGAMSNPEKLEEALIRSYQKTQVESPSDTMSDEEVQAELKAIEAEIAGEISPNEIEISEKEAEEAGITVTE